MISFSMARPTEREVARSAAELPNPAPSTVLPGLRLALGRTLPERRSSSVSSHICEQYGDPLTVCQGFMRLSYEIRCEDDQAHY